jgi:hypothetical protein
MPTHCGAGAFACQPNTRGECASLARRAQEISPVHKHWFTIPNDPSPVPGRKIPARQLPSALLPRSDSPAAPHLHFRPLSRMSLATHQSRDRKGAPSPSIHFVHAPIGRISNSASETPPPFLKPAPHAIDLMPLARVPARRAQEIRPVRKHWVTIPHHLSPVPGRKTSARQLPYAPYRGFKIARANPHGSRRGLSSSALRARPNSPAAPHAIDLMPLARVPARRAQEISPVRKHWVTIPHHPSPVPGRKIRARQLPSALRARSNTTSFLPGGPCPLP